jgi:hypothetical protein
MAKKNVSSHASKPRAATNDQSVSMSPMANSRPLVLERDKGEPEHRGFPRAALETAFRLSIGQGEQTKFSAVLASANLSVSGAFLKSSFFLPIGTELKVNFSVDDEDVEATAEVVREERRDERAGFAIRFVDFFGQSEVAMAKLFLGDVLRVFAHEYLNSKRGKGAGNEMERAIDLLAAWELRRINTPTDAWRPEVAEKEGKKGKGR